MNLSGTEREVYSPTYLYQKRKNTNELNMQLMKLENEQNKCKKSRRQGQPMAQAFGVWCS